ncbi:hypothetical protein IOK49_00330 [Fervidicoccus fontis]|uniref:Uncharacterized protein n=2 Tax=Fervidicoccus fontis TaxID=683846 RepID=I0A2F1_FERFK|nr:hypothetical protein [Fervidicoccus fontis]AFH43158.1 hypothetical protein FFONT_1170 [Fervidicoccus fontis Kam940]MBE9390537.1 hypothetical protein [Fervidicoccus fontis]PMB76941.1 MAG: hypothetical protein C0177_04710 [Fervidicoccus fontis]HEW63949.1 hypothetical protein [Fervidicoccus fontis]
MADYLEQLKEQISVKLNAAGIKILPKEKMLRLVKDMEIIMTITDKGDYIELSYKGQTYKYDKWYSKPEHLAPIILRTLNVQ